MWRRIVGERQARSHGNRVSPSASQARPASCCTVQPLFKQKTQGKFKGAAPRRLVIGAVMSWQAGIQSRQLQQTDIDNAGEIQSKSAETYLSEFGGLLEVPLQTLQGHIVVLEIGAMALAATALQPGVGGLLIGRGMVIVVLHDHVIVVWNVACAGGARMMMGDSAVTEGIDRRAAPRIRMAC
jgi:hypothetical protein